MADEVWGPHLPRDLNSSAGVPSLFTAPGGQQYGLVVTYDRRGLVCKRDRPSGGAWSTFDLASIAGNPMSMPVTEDPHCSLELAVDSLGKIHVMGNSHSNLSPVPPNGCFYVRSVNAHDITSWVDASTTMHCVNPSRLPTYQDLHRFSDGTLVCLYRGENSTNGTTNQTVVVSMERLAPGATNWTDLTPPITYTSTNGQFPGIYLASFVDRNDRLHLHYNYDNDHTAALDARFDQSYVYSDDKGSTWHTVTGASLTPTWTNTGAGAAAKTGYANTGTIMQTGQPALDKLGYPRLPIAYGAVARQAQVWWDGSAWQSADMTYQIFRYATNMVNVDGDVWSYGVEGHQVVAKRETDGAVRRLGTAGSFGANYDRELWKRTGIVELMVPDGDTPKTYQLSGKHVHA